MLGTPQTMAVVVLLLRLPLQGMGGWAQLGRGTPRPPREGPIWATVQMAKCQVCQVRPCDGPRLLIYPTVSGGNAMHGW